MRGSGLPQLLPTERPRCPTCRECMDLQRVDPGLRGFENRVFECGRCYTMKTVPAAIGPTKSRSSKSAESRLFSQGELYNRAENGSDITQGPNSPQRQPPKVETSSTPPA